MFISIFCKVKFCIFTNELYIDNPYESRKNRFFVSQQS